MEPVLRHTQLTPDELADLESLGLVCLDTQGMDTTVALTVAGRSLVAGGAI
jgi:hypothetical protein